MFLLTLLKEVVSSMKEQKAPVFLALLIIMGEYLISYVDQKHDAGIKKIETVKQEIRADLDRDRGDLKDALQDIKRSVQITESRVFELYRDQARKPRNTASLRGY